MWCRFTSIKQKHLVPQLWLQTLWAAWLNEMTYIEEVHPGSSKQKEWWLVADGIYCARGWLVVGRKGQKGVVVFFGFTTEVRTTRLFYIYGSWVSKRILILRDRIPNSVTCLTHWSYSPPKTPPPSPPPSPPPPPTFAFFFKYGQNKLWGTLDTKSEFYEHIQMKEHYKTYSK